MQQKTLKKFAIKMYGGFGMPLKKWQVVEHEPEAHVDPVRKSDDEKGKSLLRHPKAKAL